MSRRMPPSVSRANCRSTRCSTEPSNCFCVRSHPALHVGDGCREAPHYWRLRSGGRTQGGCVPRSLPVITWLGHFAFSFTESLTRRLLRFGLLRICAIPRELLQRKILAGVHWHRERYLHDSSL